MPLTIHCLQHVPFEGPAAIARWAEDRGHRLRCTPLYEGTPPPVPAPGDWLLVMGGPMGVADEARYPWLVEEKRTIAAAVEAGCTVVGVCLGAQLIAEVMGARVYRNHEPEIGWFPVRRVAAPDGDPLAAVLPESFTAFHWHGDTFDLPAGAVHLLESEACAHQAFAWEGRVLALQCHLETTPEAARALVEHCGDELVPGRPWVQDAGAILAGSDGCGRLNQILARLLDVLPGGRG